MLKRIKRFFGIKIVDKTPIAIWFLTEKIHNLKMLRAELDEEISEIKKELVKLKLEIIGVLNE